MKSIVLFIFLVFSKNINSFAQLKYPVVGTYKGKSAQGMAIWEDKAYLFNDGGFCRVLDLKTGIVSDSLTLGSARKNNHSNSASFGSEKVAGNKTPVIYISECWPPFRCFVENISGNVSQTVQTLKIDREGTDSIAKDWVVDRKHKLIYGIANLDIVDKKTGNRRFRITSYRLPKLSEGKEVHLTDEDAKDSFDVFFPNVLQGASIYKNRLYMPVGFQKGLEKRLDSERAVIVIDLKKKQIEKKVILEDVIEVEPEDMDFYRGEPLLYCGQKGGLYRLNLK